MLPVCEQTRATQLAQEEELLLLSLGHGGFAQNGELVCNCVRVLHTGVLPFIQSLCRASI